MRIRQEKCHKCGRKIPPGNVCIICKREDRNRGATPPPQPQARPTTCGKCGRTKRGGVCPGPDC